MFYNFISDTYKYFFFFKGAYFARWLSVLAKALGSLDRSRLVDVLNLKKRLNFLLFQRFCAELRCNIRDLFEMYLEFIFKNY